MAPEEMAGPRYRGLGMSRWASTVALEIQTGTSECSAGEKKW